MGVIVNKENDGDLLSRRISADLRAKLAESEKDEGSKDPDFAEDSDYVKDLKKTGKFTWVFLALFVIAVIVSFFAFGPFSF